jgi:hypothetical protein
MFRTEIYGKIVRRTLTDLQKSRYKAEVLRIFFPGIPIEPFSSIANKLVNL